jgi:hypothetical protein
VARHFAINRIEPEVTEKILLLNSKEAKRRGADYMKLTVKKAYVRLTFSNYGQNPLGRCNRTTCMDTRPQRKENETLRSLLKDGLNFCSKCVTR